MYLNPGARRRVRPVTGPGGRPDRRPGADWPAGPALRLRRGLAGAAAAGVLAAVIPALPAAAGGIGGGTFGLTPAPASDGQVPSYFRMTVAPGGRATGIAVIANPGRTTERLRIGPAEGVTAGNGGSAFTGAFQRCSGAGCWVKVRPASVTLPPDSREGLRVTVHVPRGTPDRQYLAGVTAERATRPRPVRVGGRGGARAQAIIIEQVTVGVAVTVGPRSQLTTRLRIPRVLGEDIGRVARLNIWLDNPGQTFAHGTGRASCTAGGRHRSFAVVASTVLPGDHAVIAVNAPGVPEGATVPCTVVLRYGRGLTARWAGQIAIPAPPHTRVVHTGLGTYSVVSSGSGILPWLIGLLTVGVLILAALAVLIRRRRPVRPSAGRTAADRRFPRKGRDPRSSAY